MPFTPDDETKPTPGFKPDPEPPDEHTVGGFLGNVGSGLARIVTNPIMHPINTAKGMIAPFEFPVRKGLEAIEGKEIPPTEEEQSMRNAYAQRYGGLRNIGESLYHDPVGVASDVSLAATPLGALPGRIGEAASAVSEATNPMTLPLKAAGGLAKATGKGLGSSAIGITRANRGQGATPGKFLMEETRGFRPETVAETGQESLDKLMAEREAGISVATKPIPLDPYRTKVTQAQLQATGEGNLARTQQLAPIAEALQKNRVTGTPYGATLSPREALNLERGISGEFADWNPETHQPVNALVKDVYRGLGNEIEQAAPGTRAIGQRIQSGIPVVHRAESASRGPGMIETGVNRAIRPTGALALPLMAAHAGGPIGALMAIAAQEGLTSPVFRMALARAAYGTGRGIGSPNLRQPLLLGSRLGEEQ